MYIHGGRDIKEGAMGNMWKLNISGVEELEEDSNYGVCWEQINEKGTSPGKVSHHKPIVFGSQVVIFGGIAGINGINDVFEFDTAKNAWSKLKQSGDIPKPRDDHSVAKIDADRFIIFGGFVEGSRVNECFICTKNGSILEWKEVGSKSAISPCIRASHSACFNDGKMYIFGGQDDDNNKLNDLWCFDLETEEFTQMDLDSSSYQPSPRSGHSANIHNGKMYIFGGILELTKELNELICFDFGKNCFELMGGQSQIPEDDDHKHESHGRDGEGSPGMRGNNQGLQSSPAKIMKKNNFASTIKSPTKTARAKAQGKLKLDSTTGDKQESGLVSPTSISMQNSFIIKNADESFDAYFA